MGKDKTTGEKLYNIIKDFVEKPAEEKSADGLFETIMKETEKQYGERDKQG